MASAKTAKENKVYCHDCRTPIKTKAETIENGVMLDYELAGEKITIFKCRDCFDKNPSLTNFRKCEVYSRIVGYLRPVSQWNVGKRQEYEERKEYVVQ